MDTPQSPPAPEVPVCDLPGLEDALGELVNSGFAALDDAPGPDAASPAPAPRTPPATGGIDCAGWW